MLIEVFQGDVIRLCVYIALLVIIIIGVLTILVVCSHHRTIEETKVEQKEQKRSCKKRRSDKVFTYNFRRKITTLLLFEFSSVVSALLFSRVCLFVCIGVSCIFFQIKYLSELIC